MGRRSPTRVSSSNVNDDELVLESEQPDDKMGVWSSGEPVSDAPRTVLELEEGDMEGGDSEDGEAIECRWPDLHIVTLRAQTLIRPVPAGEVAACKKEMRTPIRAESAATGAATLTPDIERATTIEFCRETMS